MAGNGCGHWWLAVVMLLLSAAADAADVTASLDRNRIVAGETVTLTIQTSDPQQSLDTDLSALEQDFTVLDRRSETQMSVVNGRQSAVVRLLVTLEPKHEGELTVPSLHFGSAVTQPQKLHVEPAPEPQPDELPPVSIDVEIEPADGPHYVHAQMLLTVRVYYLPNLTEAAITPPEPSPAVVRLLDEVPYQADRGGIRYRVLERHYAVFPERSGPLDIPAMQLTGRLVERRSDQLWQPAVRGRRIQVSSDPVHLDILPKPDGYTGDAWRPARSLEAAQNVTGVDALKVGEPVTRTVLIDAVGLEENMLTVPDWPEVPDARIYPDQPQGITRDDGKWVLGHKEFRYAVVPEKPGELVLPELEVAWWDTVNDRQAEAVLPEVRVNVLPSGLPESAAAPSPPSAPDVAALRPQPAGDLPPGTGGGRYWMALAVLFAVLWLATLGLYLRRPQVAVPVSGGTGTPDSGERDRLNRLQRACAQGDSAGARAALTQWLRHDAPGRFAGSLRELAAEAREDGDSDLADAVLHLDAAGFAPGAIGGWDGSGLWRRFGAWRRSQARRGDRPDAAITDLYRPEAR